MPILHSSKKALRSSRRKAAGNQKLRNKFARAKNKALKLIEIGESKLAQEQLQSMYKVTDKAAKRHIIPKKRADRIKSRITKKLNTTKKDVKTAPKTS
jgi:ribosomal protein S20